VTVLESQALVVRTVPFGEIDVIATLITEGAGKVSAIVHGARKGSRRIGGALEPIHTIAVRIEDRGTDLATLKEARFERLRAGAVGRLDALEAAGVALRWARHLFPPRTPEPEGWRVLIELLDALDSLAPEGGSARPPLARAGLGLLAAVGYGLDLDGCVVCGRACPEDRPACVDPERGGLVCRACGGAQRVLAPAVRRAARSLALGEAVVVCDADAETLLGLVDRAMAAHAGFER
jgi:DNA repair protein RecO (recombination protein O)